MVALTNSQGDLITNLAGEIVPNYKTTKVVKQLLSGAHHVQTIGAGARIVTAELLAQPVGRELLNKAESTGEPLRLETRSKYYVGVLDTPLKWKREAKDIYRTSIVMLISEEGDI